MQEIQDNEEMQLQIIATGMHLSTEFGLTHREITNDGFEIDSKVDMLLSSDTPTSISKSLGLGMIGFADSYSVLQPDLLVVLGDRFEIFAAVSAAMIHRIPVAHLHGGESTEGLIDESIRHAITKMSHIHFTSTEQYRERVIQLGELPQRVFNVGAFGLDNIQNLNLMSQDELEKSLGVKLFPRSLAVTFHPVTLESGSLESQVSNLLDALREFDDVKLIFTMVNADTDGRIIDTIMKKFAKENPERVSIQTSLGQLRYLSLLKYVDGVIGNSSSGIIEAPSFKIGTVNIGDRQKGRIKGESVIDCLPTKEEIVKAISTLYSDDFQSRLNTIVNPYGSHGAANKTIQQLAKIPLEGMLKKSFFDVKIPREITQAEAK